MIKKSRNYFFLPICSFFIWIALGFLSDGCKCCCPSAPLHLLLLPLLSLPLSLSPPLVWKHYAGVGSDTVNCHSLSSLPEPSCWLMNPHFLKQPRVDDWQEVHSHTEFKWEASGEETLSVSNIHSHTDTHPHSAWREKCDLCLRLLNHWWPPLSFSFCLIINMSSSTCFNLHLELGHKELGHKEIRDTSKTVAYKSVC